jgi:hypothetical protein
VRPEVAVTSGPLLEHDLRVRGRRPREERLRALPRQVLREERDEVSVDDVDRANGIGRSERRIGCPLVALAEGPEVGERVVDRSLEDELVGRAGALRPIP